MINFETGGCSKSQASPYDVDVSIVMGVSNNSCFIMENPSKIDDLGVPLFQETTMLGGNFFSFKDCVLFRLCFSSLHWLPGPSAKSVAQSTPRRSASGKYVPRGRALGSSPFHQSHCLRSTAVSIPGPQWKAFFTARRCNLDFEVQRILRRV